MIDANPAPEPHFDDEPIGLQRCAKSSKHNLFQQPASYAAVTTRLRSTAQGDHSDNPFRFMLTLFDVSLDIAMPQTTFNANEATSGVSDAHTATGQASATDDMRSNSTSATNDTLSN
jgi:hypothetical protein